MNQPYAGERSKKIAFYQDHVPQITGDKFACPKYKDILLSHGLRCIIGQIDTSSHAVA